MVVLASMVLLVYALVIVIELIPSFRQASVKEGVISCVLLSVSFVVLLLYSFGINVPGPSDAIKNFIQIFVRF